MDWTGLDWTGLDLTRGTFSRGKGEYDVLRLAVGLRGDVLFRSVGLSPCSSLQRHAQSNVCLL